MDTIWIIAKRELRSFFDSLMAYIMIVLFLGFTGFFTWISGTNVFAMDQASLQVFFNISYWTLFFFIPALTMRLIAEEKKTGTLEILFTKPVSDWQLVMGKFISTLILIAIALVLTLPYYFTIWDLGNVDHGAVWTAYLGLLFMSATYISIGLFASSLSDNQIIAFLVALAIGIFFHILFGMIAQSFTGVLGSIFDFLDLRSHFESISRGVIDTKDVIYFISISFAGLFATEGMLARRNLTD